MNLSKESLSPTPRQSPGATDDDDEHANSILPPVRSNDPQPAVPGTKTIKNAKSKRKVKPKKKGDGSRPETNNNVKARRKKTTIKKDCRPGDPSQESTEINSESNGRSGENIEQNRNSKVKRKKKQRKLRLSPVAASSAEESPQKRANKKNRRRVRASRYARSGGIGMDDDSDHEDDESEDDEEERPGAHHIGGSSNPTFSSFSVSVNENISSRNSSSPQDTLGNEIKDPHLLQAEVVDEDERRREFQTAVNDAVHNALQGAAVVAVAVDQTESNDMSDEEGRQTEEVDKADNGAACSKQRVVAIVAALIMATAAVAVIVVFASDSKPNPSGTQKLLSVTASPTPSLETASPTQAPVLILPVPDCDPADCANVYNKGGCLYQNLNLTSYIRTCNSADAAEANRDCIRKSSTPQEVRILIQNWDTAIIQAWAMQIILSELAGIPTTIESGQDQGSADFYDVENRLEIGFARLEPLEVANDVRDCTTLEEEEEYISCAHVLPEINDVHWGEFIENLRSNVVVGAPQNIGFAYQRGLYIPKHTLLKDPSLVSYQFLSGEENRRKLAETFLTPTSWHDYCEFVSPDKCSVPNHIAQRLPIGFDEEQSYFVEDLYTGHFRATERNDCDRYPTSCAGYVVVPPCGWSTNIEQQLYHNSIFLEGDRLDITYSGMMQIWKAAKATKSDVIMEFYTPDTFLYDFSGTDYEFQRVQLPIPNQQCLDNRLDDFSIRCSASDLSEVVGHPDGACDSTPEPQSRLVTHNLRQDNPEAYNAISSFVFLQEDLDEIFADKSNRNNLRDATCQWVANHRSLIESRLA